jgi:hypothetical protein
MVTEYSQKSNTLPPGLSKNTYILPIVGTFKLVFRATGLLSKSTLFDSFES